MASPPDTPEDVPLVLALQTGSCTNRRRYFLPDGPAGVSSLLCQLAPQRQPAPPRLTPRTGR